MLRMLNLAWWLVLSLSVPAFSLELNQSFATNSPTANAQSAGATSDIANVPVTWSDLHLTGKLIYPSSVTNGNQVTATIQMLDLVTGQLSTVFRVSDAWVYYLSVSPDAKWFLMSYAPPAQGGSASTRALYIMPFDASTPPKLLFTPPTPDDHYTQIEWSTDGRYIYFVHYNHAAAGGQPNEVYEIFRMTYPNGNPEKIVDRAFWPRLSSDANKLAYVSLDPASGTNELFFANADGSNPQKVTLSGAYVPDIIDAPLFLPGGASLLFSAPSPGQSYQPGWVDRFMGVQVAKAHSIPSDWWSVPMAGGVPTRLTNIQAVNLFASLSPDQKHIVSLNGQGLFVMNLDGASLTQLISDPSAHGTASWIP